MRDETVYYSQLQERQQKRLNNFWDINDALQKSLTSGINWLTNCSCSAVGRTGCITALIFTAVFMAIHQSRFMFVSYQKSNQPSFHQQNGFLVAINCTTYMICIGYYYWNFTDYLSMTERIKCVRVRSSLVQAHDFATKGRNSIFYQKILPSLQLLTRQFAD